MSFVKFVCCVLGTVCVVPVFSGQASGVNLLVNGSFESGPAVPEPPGYLVLEDGDTSIPGWEVHALASGGTVDYKSTYWQHSDGQRSVDLNGTPGPGSIQQSFATVAGETYRVRFDIASNPGLPSNPVKTMEVSAAGQSQQFVVDSTGHSMFNMGWDTHEWDFIANSNSTTLVFSSVFPFGTTQGVGLDNVSVNQVPELATCLLLVLGFAGGVPLARRWATGAAGKAVRMTVRRGC